MIRALNEAVLTLPEGSAGLLVVPPHLGYVAEESPTAPLRVGMLNSHAVLCKHDTQRDRSLSEDGAFVQKREPQPPTVEGRRSLREALRCTPLFACCCCSCVSTCSDAAPCMTSPPPP